MPNYRESNINGQKWTRSNEVRIRNPFNGIATANFKEEEVVYFDGDYIVRKSGEVGDTLQDPTKTFDALNPVDDSVTGTYTYQEVYTILYSLYRHLADQRDLDAQQPQEG